MTLCEMPGAEWGSGKLPDVESENPGSHLQLATDLLCDLGQVTSSFGTSVLLSVKWI